MSPVKSICRPVSGREALCAFFFASTQLITRCHCSSSPVATVCVLYGLPAPLPVSHLRRDISPTCVYNRGFRPTCAGQRPSADGLFSFRCLSEPSAETAEEAATTRTLPVGNVFWGFWKEWSGAGGDPSGNVLVSNVCFWRDSRMNGVLDYLEF